MHDWILNQWTDIKGNAKWTVIILVFNWAWNRRALCFAFLKKRLVGLRVSINVGVRPFRKIFEVWPKSISVVTRFVFRGIASFKKAKGVPRGPVLSFESFVDMKEPVVKIGRIHFHRNDPTFASIHFKSNYEASLEIPHLKKRIFTASIA